MPPRKAKKTPIRKEDSAPSDTATPSTVSKKRKIDWSSIDEPETFEGFTLKSVNLNKRRKSGHPHNQDNSTTADDADALAYKDASLSADIVQTNPFPEGVLSSAHYMVEPAHIWESTKRYRKFTISEAEFEVGQCVFLEKTPEEQDSEDAMQHWVGRVLEVRAGDASHVYLRVYWFYRPEDLPGGRQPHHGESELIASNHMDIIEALSVSDRAEVMYWDEDPEKPWPLKHQLFWRQTFDLRTTKAKQLSPIRKICVDKTPCNPDEPLVQCSSCSAWLHAKCLEDDAVRDATSKYEPQAKKSATPGKKKRGRPSSSSSSEPPPFTAYLSTLGESGTTYLTVTDHRPDQKKRRFNVDLTCLECNALIEAAPEEIPPEPPTTTKVVAKKESTSELPTMMKLAALIDEKGIKSLLPGAESVPDLKTEPSPQPNVRGRGSPRKKSLPVKDVRSEEQPLGRKRGRPRKKPHPVENVAMEPERVDEEQEEEQEPVEQQQQEQLQDIPNPAIVPDEVEVVTKPEPYTPMPVATPVSQSMFGSMRKLLFRGGI